jgi:hypothetical protein
MASPVLRCRALLATLALAGALSAPRVAAADRRTDARADQQMSSAGVTNLTWSASARLAAPLRALLARFLRIEPERPAPPAALEEEFDAEAMDRARASRRAEQGERAAVSGGAARDARRASAPSNP